MADTPRAASDDIANGAASAPIASSASDEALVSSFTSASDHGPSSSRAETAATATPQQLTPAEQRERFGKRHINTVQERLAEAQRVLDAGDKDAIMRMVVTPLRAAALNADASTISQILETGADVNAKNELGETALHMAAMRDHSGLCVPILIAAGADVHATNTHGDTALMYAAFSNDEASVRALLQAGANRAAKSVDGCTAHGVASKVTVRNLLR